MREWTEMRSSIRGGGTQNLQQRPPNGRLESPTGLDIKEEWQPGANLSH